MGNIEIYMKQVSVQWTSINQWYVIGTVANGLYIVSEDGRESTHFNFEKGLLKQYRSSI